MDTLRTPVEPHLRCRKGGVTWHSIRTRYTPRYRTIVRSTLYMVLIYGIPFGLSTMEMIQIKTLSTQCGYLYCNLPIYRERTYMLNMPAKDTRENCVRINRRGGHTTGRSDEGTVS